MHSWKRTFVFLALSALIIAAVFAMQNTTQDNAAPAQEKTEKTSTDEKMNDTSDINAPSLRLISPNGGEVWLEGNTYTIRWTAENIDHVSIAGAIGGHDKGIIADNIDASLGEFSWTIPQGYVTGFGIESTGDAYIMVFEPENPVSISDKNDSAFTIQGENHIRGRQGN